MPLLKMSKWAVCLIICQFILIFGAAAYAASPSLDDVPKDHWAYEAVDKLIKAGLADGYSDGTFRGRQTVTRYEFAIVITKALAISCEP